MKNGTFWVKFSFSNANTFLSILCRLTGCSPQSIDCESVQMSAPPTSENCLGTAMESRRHLALWHQRQGYNGVCHDQGTNTHTWGVNWFLTPSLKKGNESLGWCSLCCQGWPMPMLTLSSLRGTCWPSWHHWPFSVAAF